VQSAGPCGKGSAAVTDRSFINVDTQMRTDVPQIFAIGDIVGQPIHAHPTRG
jgi:dihydrolipoamide dehydrogenase